MFTFEIKSLLQGISEQSSTVANPISAKDMKNLVPSPVRGLARFPSIERVFTENNSTPIDKDVITSPITGHKLRLNLSGTVSLVDVQTNTTIPITVNPDAATYLANADTGNISSRDVGDLIILWDNKVTVQEVASTVTASNSVLIFVKEINPAYAYNVYDDGVLIATQGMVATAQQPTVAASLATSISSSRPAWTVLVSGSVLLVTPNDSSVVTVNATVGSASTTVLGIFSFQGKAEKIDDLPAEAFHNYLVRLEGSVSDDNRQYIKFLADNGVSGTGRWVETVAPAAATTLNKTTIPMVLKFVGLGLSAVLEPLALATRQVGDAELNPSPAFVGKAINDITEHKNRIAFLTKRNIDLSDSGDPLNFYRDTVSVLDDSQPISLDIPTTSVSDECRFCISYQDDLLVYSDSTIVTVFAQDGILTPKNATTAVQSNSGVSSSARPSPNDLSVFSLSVGTNNVSMIEMFRQDVGVYGQATVNNHAPTIIKPNARSLKAASRFNMAFMINGDNELMVFVHLTEGQKRIQQAFTRRTTPFDYLEGLSLDEKGGDLYLYGTVGSDWCVMKMNLDITANLSPTVPFNIHLDDQIRSSTILRQEANPSTFVNSNVFSRPAALTNAWLADDYICLGYSTTANIVQVVTPLITPTEIYVPAEMNRVIFGRIVDGAVVLHTLYKPGENGEIEIDTFAISDFTVQCDNAISLRVESKNIDNNFVKERRKSNVRLGLNSATIGTLKPKDHIFRFSRMGINVNTEITLITESWFPAAVTKLYVRGVPYGTTKSKFGYG